jgi:hypothetical protein
MKEDLSTDFPGRRQWKKKKLEMATWIHMLNTIENIVFQICRR